MKYAYPSIQEHSNNQAALLFQHLDKNQHVPMVAKNLKLHRKSE